MALFSSKRGSMWAEIDEGGATRDSTVKLSRVSRLAVEAAGETFFDTISRYFVKL